MTQFKQPVSPTKPALGKGLQALMGTRDYEPGERIARIPVNDINPNPNQPRRIFDEHELRELTESLSEHGLLQPIIVTRAGEGNYLLVAGERRLIAAKAAGWAEIPAIIKDYNELQTLQIALVENIQRENLNDMELAHAYQELAEIHGKSQAEIARLVGKSRPTIANTLRLLDLPGVIQDGIIYGKITAGHARALLAASEERREKLFERIIKRGLSVREVERLAAKNEGEKSAQPSDASLETLSRGLEDRLHRRVTITRGVKGGKLAISFRDDDDLNDLLARLSRI